jgi:alpha,alpha-trehalase
MGNFPQAFSHIGIIASGVNLARARQRERRPA